MDVVDIDFFDIVEVSFKNGVYKGFYCNQDYICFIIGDDVVVEIGIGFDVGRIILLGELVCLQMKKKKIFEKDVFYKIICKVNEWDLECLVEVWSFEMMIMVCVCVIVCNLKLEMKIGDVEY